MTTYFRRPFIRYALTIFCNCQWCNREFKHEHEATIDHIIPKSKGGLKTCCLVDNFDTPQSKALRRFIFHLISKKWFCTDNHVFIFGEQTIYSVSV